MDPPRKVKVQTCIQDQIRDKDAQIIQRLVLYVWRSSLKNTPQIQKCNLEREAGF